MLKPFVRFDINSQRYNMEYDLVHVFLREMTVHLFDMISLLTLLIEYFSWIADGHEQFHIVSHLIKSYIKIQTFYNHIET